MFQILVVCHANVCRSPYAAQILRSQFPQNRDISIISAGLEAVPGQGLCPVAATELGDSAPVSHTSQLVDAALVESSDLLLSMGQEQSATMAAMWPQERNKIYGLVQAAVSADVARHRGLMKDDQWPYELPTLLHELRGMAHVPALPNPRRFFGGPMTPGRIPDGHGLSRPGHLRVLQQVKEYAQLLATRPEV